MHPWKISSKFTGSIFGCAESVFCLVFFCVCFHWNLFILSLFRCVNGYVSSSWTWKIHASLRTIYTYTRNTRLFSYSFDFYTEIMILAWLVWLPIVFISIRCFRMNRDAAYRNLCCCVESLLRRLPHVCRWRPRNATNENSVAGYWIVMNSSYSVFFFIVPFDKQLRGYFVFFSLSLSYFALPSYP